MTTINLILDDISKIVNTKIWIKEVILENFMSYEYARIPLKNGLNLICGPNGAGKSSILVAISVALGQIYTERSKRLGNLIRWGKDIARVTLIFDNRPMNGKRPIPFSRSDEFMLSRYLKKDGTYWYEGDYREISSYGVNRLFKGFGMDPDNMLIIMHQNMMEKFGLTTRQEKLKLLEEAVGFAGYREKILESRQKLEKLASEDESISQILDKAGETFHYWKKMHEKWMKKKKLEEKKEFLKREEVWARIARREMKLSSLEEKLDSKERMYQDIIKGIKNAKARIADSASELNRWKSELREAFYTLLNFEKEKVRFDFKEKNEKNKKIKELEKKIGEAHAELARVEENLDSHLEEHIRNRVEEEIGKFRKGMVKEEMREIKDAIRKEKKKLDSLRPLMKDVGERIHTERNPREIREEMNLLDARIDSLGEIPKETEEMHSKFSDLYEEIKEKSSIVKENKEKTLEKLKERKKIWKKAINDLLKEIIPSYREFLSNMVATGTVHLMNAEDIEEAGLELLVGFRGSSPVLLDAFTQSGGERTAAVMSFLLSIQEHLKSPFRAIDEFDLHMDPRNREAIYRLIVSSATGNGQSIIITPSQITMTDPSVHIVVVQNTYGKSTIKEVVKNEK